jgi:hypothetical protein
VNERGAAFARQREDGLAFSETRGRTAEEDGERIVEELRGLWVDDVAALQFPCFREERSVLAFAVRFRCGFVLVLVGARCSSGADHSLPDVERIGP